ncbi:MAG TPA: hypothetical protein VK325_01710 [Pseudoxanthomonas sp.]|nr:hypothetical protein [Pseudoxanthomonas sp.]
MIFYLEQAISAPRLTLTRDSYIRQAALHLPAGSLFSQASALHVEASKLCRVRYASPPADPATFRELLQVAAACAPLPRSRRQFLRILQASRV